MPYSSAKLLFLGFILEKRCLYLKEGLKKLILVTDNHLGEFIFFFKRQSLSKSQMITSQMNVALISSKLPNDGKLDRCVKMPKIINIFRCYLNLYVM